MSGFVAAGTRQVTGVGQSITRRPRIWVGFRGKNALEPGFSELLYRTIYALMCAFYWGLPGHCTRDCRKKQI